MPKAVVLIEDDVLLHETLKDSISKGLGIEVVSFYSAEDYLRSDFKSVSAMFLIDSELPGIKGPDIVRMIRQTDKISPIIMMSGLQETVFISNGLKSGADDFLVKPFNIDHLLMKLKNAQVKASSIFDNLMNKGIKLVPEGSMVMHNGLKVRLSAREYQVLNFFVERPNVVHPRRSVVSSFNDKETNERNVDFLVSSLRKKITSLGVEIETVRGEGYRMAGI